MGTSKDVLFDEIEKVKEKNRRLAKANLKLRNGFNIMIEYFDCIQEEEREEVGKRLEVLGL